MDTNLFRFMLIRPPRRVSEKEAAHITIQPYAGEQSQFAQIVSQQGSAEQARPLAANYLKSNQFVANFNALPNGKAIAALDQWLIENPKPDAEAWRAAVAEQFPNQNGDIHQITTALHGDCLRLADSLLALVVARERRDRAQALIVRGLRICRMVGMLGDMRLTDRGLWLGLQSLVVLPMYGLKLKPPPEAETSQPDARARKINAGQEALVKELNTVKGAIRELSETYNKKRLAAAHRQQSHAAPAPGGLKDGDGTAHGNQPADSPRHLSENERCALSDCTRDLLDGYPSPLDILTTIKTLEGKLSSGAGKAVEYCKP